jgi:hypothetical protein
VAIPVICGEGFTKKREGIDRVEMGSLSEVEMHAQELEKEYYLRGFCLLVSAKGTV